MNTFTEVVIVKLQNPDQCDYTTNIGGADPQFSWPVPLRIFVPPRIRAGSVASRRLVHFPHTPPEVALSGADDVLSLTEGEVLRALRQGGTFPGTLTSRNAPLPENFYRTMRKTP